MVNYQITIDLYCCFVVILCFSSFSVLSHLACSGTGCFASVPIPFVFSSVPGISFGAISQGGLANGSLPMVFRGDVSLHQQFTDIVNFSLPVFKIGKYLVKLGLQAIA